MDQLRKSIREAEELRKTLPQLREDRTLEGLMTYYKVMLDVTERQHNMYARLRLMDDPESVQTADEMVHVAEQHMGKALTTSMDTFFDRMEKELKIQISALQNL